MSTIKRKNSDGTWEYIYSGAGKQLPDVTTSDNGKIAQVVNGLWDKSELQTSLSSSSTNQQVPSAKVVYDTTEDIREVAQGKTATFVVSYVDNPTFNSQNDTITLTGTFEDINNITHNVTEVKLGDNFYVIQTDVPDRWCGVSGSTLTLYRLETAKVPVMDVRVDGTTVVNNGVADITGKEDVANKITSISSSSTDTQYPSAKAVKDYVDNAIASSVTSAIDGSY